VVVADTTGKYIRDGVEVKSSEESLDEEKQKKLWEMTGGYAHLDGFAPLDVPPPPAEPVPEEPKTEPKPEEANGEAAKDAEDTPIITDSNKPEEIKSDEKGAGQYYYYYYFLLLLNEDYYSGKVRFVGSNATEMR